jgi:hypothetical protein
MSNMAGPVPFLIARGADDAITVADGDVELWEGYVPLGVKGMVLDFRHEASGAAVITYTIQSVPFTSGLADFDVSYTTLLASTAVAKATAGRLVVYPGVIAVANTHANTVLGYKIRININADTATADEVYAAITWLP